jgi:hypothetical protein
MTWSWSHTDEAYQNVRDNIADLSQDTLKIILAEWQEYVAGGRKEREFNLDRYEKYLSAMSGLFIGETAQESIYQLAKQESNCENGGYEAWVCPYGCHRVSFDREQEDGYSITIRS